MEDYLKKKEQILSELSEIRRQYVEWSMQENASSEELPSADDWNFGLKGRAYTSSDIQLLEQVLGLSLPDSFRFALQQFGAYFVHLQYGYKVIDPESDWVVHLKGFACAFNTSDSSDNYIHPTFNLSKLLLHNKARMLEQMQNRDKDFYCNFD